MTCRVGAVAFLLSIALPLLGDERPNRAPRERDQEALAWKRSTEERIELRLDPAGMRERVKAARDAEPPPSPRGLTQAFGFASPEDFFLVDGARNPELLMPSELFQSIDTTSETEEGRKRYADKLASFGWDENAFWKALSDATAEYRKLTEESLSLQRSLRVLNSLESRDVIAKVESLQIPQCRARFEALQRMRESYGEDFDRFLYLGVAPYIRISSTPPGADETFRLRFIEGGCQ